MRYAGGPAARSARRLVLAFVPLALGAGCEVRRGMYDQPRYEPLEASDFFGDRRSARPPVDGTVARGHLNEDRHLFTGMAGEDFAETFPYPVTRAVLERGQTLFDIHCSPCHDRAGYGKGLVVQRGFKPAASFHIDRLRQAKPGYFFSVITAGYGMMPSYSHQVGPEDRWAVAAYVRALQLSQNATLADVPESERGALAAGSP